MREPTRLLVAAVFVILGMAAVSNAQVFPERPITLVIPLPAGSSPDIAARIISEPMSKNLGQPVIMMNRVGGGGLLAFDFVRSAPPDGHTVLVTSQILAPSPDLTALAMVTESPILLVTTRDQPVRTVQELIASIKANPGQFSFGETVGSTGHLAALLFNSTTGSTATFVPFQTTAQSASAVASGHVSFSFQNLNAVLPLVRDGTLRALAVASQKRAVLLPDVPTLAEAGVPDIFVSGWIGTFVSAKVPAPIVNRLRSAVDSARQSPEVKDQFLKLGFEPSQVPSEKFDDFVREQFNQFKPVALQPPVCCPPKTCADMRICPGAR